ncbi:hypothetical protein [Mycoplasma suis]|uniref:hypothetical protein n=1 Tax=Mycoplasma suis TaxID=57372 RepID=UPI00030ADD91|nr:hypothetical protein [Mycoplasma suis]
MSLFAHYVHKELGKEKDILTCTRLFSEEITDKEEFKEEECQNFLVKEVFEGTNHAGESVMWLRTNQENFESIFKKFFDSQYIKGDPKVKGEDQEWKFKDVWGCWTVSKNDLVIVRCLKNN